jgi:hypothetical protein
MCVSDHLSITPLNCVVDVENEPEKYHFFSHEDEPQPIGGYEKRRARTNNPVNEQSAVK